MSQTPAASPVSSAAHAYAGLDVGKSLCQLAILLPTGQVLQRSIPTASGFSELVKLCREHQVALVVMEATGGLELDPAMALWNAQLSVSIIQPAQSKAFARTLGQQAKTDRIDAQLLAHFACRIRPTPAAALSQWERELRELAARRHQLVGLLVQEKNRLQQARVKLVKASIRAVIKNLERQLEDLDRHLGERVSEDAELLRAIELLDSVPGLGKRSATALLLAMPELGTLSRRTSASLAGLAPVAHDSGSHKGRRQIRGGRSAVRNALYMPTLTAIRFNSIIRDFYRRLLATGKLKMVALTAAMRKLLGILNAMLKQNKTWNQFVLKNP